MKNNVHNRNAPFFITCLNSRLGLRNTPIGQKIPNIGVENGGMAIIKNILKNNSGKIFEPHFPQPETIPVEKYLESVFTLHNQVVKKINQQWNNQFFVALGGDHSVSQISLAAALEHFKDEEVAIVMFDSHADLHLPSTSPTGNFHGMWLRSFFDQFKENHVVNKKINPNQLRYVGNLLTEEEEEKYILKNEIIIYGKDQITNQSSQDLFSWANKFTHLHISFDIDVFEQVIAPATGTPNPSGLTKSQVLTMLTPLLKHPSISLDIVELNPKKDGAKKTISLIKEIFEPIFDLHQS